MPVFRGISDWTSLRCRLIIHYTATSKLTNRDLAQKYELNIPPYEGLDQVVELPRRSVKE